jgi:flagellum-specific peptidoglycan hydrolase FlgJ
MTKKILALLLLSFLVSCGSSRSHIQTSKNGTAKRSATSPARKSRTAKPATTTRTATASTKKPSSGRQTEVLESTSKTVVYAELVKAYIDDYKDIAKDNMRRHGIPASIALAQGILESGAGRGTLSVNANNHFGIKCHKDWTGETVHHDDDAEQECFRKYSDPAESYKDHSLFLTTRGRYASLFELDKDDYAAWARGLKAAGYATDPKYPDKLIGLIERYDLARYDAEVLGKKYEPAPKVQEAPKPVMPRPEEEAVALEVGSYRVQQGDTLYSISKKHNLSVDELMSLNGLSNNAISIGQVLKVK